MQEIYVFLSVEAFNVMQASQVSLETDLHMLTFINAFLEGLDYFSVNL